MSISACILTKNAEHNIERCLQNIMPYVDEVLIIDGFSDDRTIEIAQEYTDRIFVREFSGSFAVERNYAIRKAIGDWIFMIDSDEICDIGLLNQLRKLTEQNKYVAYSFIRKDVTLDGKVLELELGYPEINVRLAKKDKIGYYGAIHERAIVFGKIKFIPDVIHHYRDYIIDYPPEKAERFREISETAKERDQGMELSKWFLIFRGSKLIVHYFFNMLLGLKLYKKGAKGLLTCIIYTVRFTFSGISKYRRHGQI